MATAPDQPVKQPNPTRTSSIIWWILTVVFFLGIFSPFFLGLAGIEAGDWQFGSGFLCLVAGITSFVVAIIYTKRARIYQNILLEKNLLAHWTYTAEEWKEYAQKEHEENKRDKRNLFWLVTVIAVIIGVFFIIFEPGDWLIFVPIILGIIVLAGGSALLATWLSYQQNRQRQGEVYITRQALILNRVLHAWKSAGAKLEQVKYQENQRKIPVIIFNYSTPSRGGRQDVTVRVPVPHGHEEEALNLAASLDPNPQESTPELLKD
jgi:hypothetical protein